MRLGLVITGAVLLMVQPAAARDVNYDEALVVQHPLPPALVGNDGAAVSTAEQWRSVRRPEVLELFRSHVYGRVPEGLGEPRFEVVSTTSGALKGLADRSHVRVSLPKFPDWQGIEMMLYTPASARGPVPVVLGLNFFGNHAITTETDVLLSERWMRPSKDMGIVDNRATSASRGKMARRWPLETILKRGYAVGTAYCGDIEPDYPEGWKDGIRGIVAGTTTTAERRGDDWGAIGAWAWGLSRMLDYCETDRRLDTKRSVVIGHSRLGKTALWAGAQDERFGLVISNNSGEGGASLARRYYGETIEIITKSFPHWFCPQYTTYAKRETEMPVDQHMLIALMAPRPVYIGSASGDRWADPKGEFLSGVHAGDVYELFGKGGLGTDVWPEVEKPVGETIGYHLREGKHDIVEYDWLQYLGFADRHFSGADN